MGYTNKDLIPAAILLDNPGITRGEFIKRLQGVRYSEDRERIRNEQGALADSVLKPFPLNLRGCKDLSRYIPKDDSAIFRFAEILKLGRRTEHLDTLGSLVRKDELLVKGRVPEIYEGLEDGTWGWPSLDWFTARKEDGLFYVDSRQPSYLTGRTQFGRFTNCSDHKEGDIVFITDTGANFYPFRIKRFAKDYGDEQLMEIEEVIISRMGKVFHSLTELLELHPYFDPEFMFDFSQTEGNLDSGFTEGFRWRKEKSEYFLDWETFRKIQKVSGSEYHPEGSYTDLILTAEAIKHGAWKLLSAYGLAYIHDFLTTFPDSKRRYDLAVEDAHYPLKDLQEGYITCEEFVRRSKAIFDVDN